MTSIPDILTSLNFVEWDRYTRVGNDHSVTYDFYGWIDRNDSYKDFVVLTLVFEKSEVTISYITSSVRYTRDIAKILNMQVHEDCRRVEELYPSIPNLVKLFKEAGE